MIIITGAAGFIGSALVGKLNSVGLNDLLLVDHLDSSEKWKNLLGKQFTDYIDRSQLLKLISERKSPPGVSAVIHFGACTSTIERDADYFIENNYRYTRNVAEWCLNNSIRFIYASSAATYGDGRFGFSDDHSELHKLRALNIYGYSKHLFDLWALKSDALKQIVGLKFFNVFGPNEYHKGEMASLIFKATNQIRNSGKLKLFKSHRPEFADGEQVRDFVFIKDCVEIVHWLLDNKKVTGLFNLGTGKARSWKDLGLAVFAALGVKPNIEFTDIPESIRDRYQYFTQADMTKLTKAGYTKPFRSLEESVTDYVQNYLGTELQYL